MFSHVTLGANDLQKSKVFYDAVMGAIGASPGVAFNENVVTYQHNGALLVILKPRNGADATHANGGTVGFLAGSPEAVDAWHAAGCANGGETCEDPPGVREYGQTKLYSAYLRDPVGNKLCAQHRFSN